MGIPNHYSRDIVIRCDNLLRHLLPKIDEGLPNDFRFGGPLRTTFLLAMATPMIVLPVERIFKPGNRRAAQVGDDRHLDPALAAELTGVLGNQRCFADAPFAQPNAWSFVQTDRLFNIADNWPEELLAELSGPKAFDAARNAPAKCILLDLRNALAHGGVIYLDKRGRNSVGQAAMFAFVSAAKSKGRNSHFKILRVSEENFAAFLTAWADWLGQQSKFILNALNNDVPIAA